MKNRFSKSDGLRRGDTEKTTLDTISTPSSFRSRVESDLARSDGRPRTPQRSIFLLVFVWILKKSISYSEKGESPVGETSPLVLASAFVSSRFRRRGHEQSSPCFFASRIFQALGPNIKNKKLFLIIK